MSFASDKGYRGEAAVLDELRIWTPEHDLYRPRAGAVRDCGDICGVPFVHSVKNCRSMSLSTWMDDLQVQVLNARLLNPDVCTGAVWHHRKGKGDPAHWYVTTTGALFRPLYLSYLNELERGR
jgi:hypothetical protein